MTSTEQYKQKWGNPGTPECPDHAWYAANMRKVVLPWAMINAMDPEGPQITSTLFHTDAAVHLVNALQAVWDTAQKHVTVAPRSVGSHDEIVKQLAVVQQPVIVAPRSVALPGATRALIHSFGGDLWCGTYNLRCVRGYEAQGILSPHAYGIAIDIDAARNPMGNPLRTTFPAWFVQCFKDHGFLWGGDFINRKDAMHFEVQT